MRTLRLVTCFHNKCVIFMDRKDFTNGIRSEAAMLPGCSFPLRVFPQKIQELILDLEHYENFKIEYSASVMLSAVAAALGNALMIHIKGSWHTNGALYMMLVGRPGLGKTPPIGFLYKPLREKDAECYFEYSRQLREYEQMTMQKGDSGPCLPEMPVLEKRILSDFTAEALINSHWNNLRGISVVSDEIMGVFKSVTRYNANSTLIELLLSAYSGQPIDYVRKSEKRSIHIDLPFINLIGSVQPEILDRVFCDEFKANGLLDRFLFVYPQDQSIAEWKLMEDEGRHNGMAVLWQDVIRRVLDIRYGYDSERHSIMPGILDFSPEAKSEFYDWNNAIIRKVNGIADDRDVESRDMKVSCNAAKIALLLQVIRYAIGECPIDTVDVTSVRGAILLMEYYEERYHRTEADASLSGKEDGRNLLDLLGDTFTSSEAVEAGKRAGISRRTVYLMLSRFSSSPGQLLVKIEHGRYARIRENGNAPCTIALSGNALCNALNDSNMHAESKCKVQKCKTAH